MKHFAVVALCAGASVAAWIATASLVDAQDRPPVPRDIIEFLTRRGICLAWSKDLDGFRATVNEDFVQSQKCDDIAKDEAALRDKYAGNPDLVPIIEGRGLVVSRRRQPGQTPAPSDSKP